MAATETKRKYVGKNRDCSVQQETGAVSPAVGVCVFSRVANGTGSPLYAYNFICSGSSPLSVLRSKIFFANYYSRRVFSAFILHILKITLKTWRYTI